MNESELLFTEVLRCERLSLYLDKDKNLDRHSTSFITKVLRERINGKPLEYILGKTEFMGLEFKVSSDVLIPRPETEILVEKVIDIVTTSLLYHFIGLRILDLGTGSGNIAISLARNLAHAEIDATDISREALKVARQNARLHNIEARVKFFFSDLFNNNKLKTNNYNFIVSNPPYVRTPELSQLSCEVKCEPKIALEGGSDGLDFYRKIISGAAVFLKKRGLLVLEVGFGQSKDIIRLFKNNGGYEIEEIVKDYSGIERVVVARKIN